MPNFEIIIKFLTGKSFEISIVIQNIVEDLIQMIAIILNTTDIIQLSIVRPTVFRY